MPVCCTCLLVHVQVFELQPWQLMKATGKDADLSIDLEGLGPTLELVVPLTEAGGTAGGTLGSTTGGAAAGSVRAGAWT